MRINTLVLLLLTILVCDNCSHIDQKPPQIPLEDFFRNPEKIAIKISPNGRYISYLAPWNNRMNLHVQEIETNKITQITFETTRDLSIYFWANDTRLIFVKDEKGNEEFKLYSVNMDGSDSKCLTCFNGGNLTLINDLPCKPQEVIIGLNLRDSTVFDPYRLNVETGEIKLLAKNPGNIIDWFVDHEGNLRLAVALVGGVNQVILYRDSENKPFLPILTTTWRDSFLPQFFTFDNRGFFALSNIGRDKLEVVVFDPKSKTETSVLFKNEQVDVTNLQFSRNRKVLTSAEFHIAKQHEHFFDETTEHHYRLIQNKLKAYNIRIESTNTEETIYIVKAYNDRAKGIYYLYRTQDETLTLIANTSSWLEEAHLATTKPVSFLSRDGLTLNGYLTLPVGVKAKNLPLIIHPHGGPWIRDFWGFNPEVQFLANRGYAVLQVNYRGSTGYGKEFWLKSVKQWGLAMQNDLTDGAKWLIDKGVADQDRIAIYGSSWGGYAALAGLTFTPDLYACGIANVGPSNLFTFMQSLPPYWQPLKEMFYEMVGDPEKDSLLLAKISPALHTDNIRAPVLIAQGSNDPRVNKAESDQMVNALRAKGKEVEYLLIENEGHGFKNEENRFAFYRTMEIFLEKNLLSKN